MRLHYALVASLCPLTVRSLSLVTGTQTQKDHSMASRISRRVWGRTTLSLLAPSCLVVRSASSAAAFPVGPVSEATPRKAVEYATVNLALAGQSVPLSVWSPLSSVNSSLERQTQTAAYEYRISISKIVKLLVGVSLPLDIGKTSVLLRPEGLVVESSGDNRRSGDLPVILFCHGYLGSRLDFCHVCERLAGEGFLVAAPELPESLSASFEPQQTGTSRPEIVAAALDKLRSDSNFRAHPSLAGIIGHSAGGGTASTIDGHFPLGRCAVAGFRGFTGTDPLFVIASKGDNVIPIDKVREAVGLSSAGGSIRTLIDLEKPCHISFLSSDTNDAMVDFLSPLLPLARFLGVPLLDFDVYASTKDSDDTAEIVIPEIVDFFKRNSEASAGTEVT